jgi:hypothetical protein
MFPRGSYPIVFALAFAAAFAFVGTADAGWITFKNDSHKTVVVQEVVTVNGRQVRGKPLKLLMGESFREFQNTPGVKCFEVLDTGIAPKALWTGKLNCLADTQSFSFAVTNGRYSVTLVEDPKKP